MTVGEDALNELLTELRVPDPHSREQAADSVTDWLNSYSSAEGDRVGDTLVRLARAESYAPAYEAQTHALAELAEQGLLSTATIRAAADLPATDDVSVTEYLDYLRSLAEGDG